MKRVEPQLQFQGFAQGQGLNAIQAPDVTPLLRQNMQTEQQNMNAFRQTALENMKLQQLTYLADFSETLGNTLVTIGKQKNEADMLDGLSKAYEDGLPSVQIEAFKEQEAQLAKTRDQLDGVAAVAQQQGADLETVSRFQQLSGWRKYGYAKGMAQQAGANYREWINNQLNSNDDIQIALADGTVFTAATAQGRAQKSAALAELRKVYMQQNGLLGMNPALLNEYAFNQMRRAEAETMGEYMRAYNTELQQQGQDEVFSEFAQTVGSDPTAFTNSLVRLRSLGLGTREARKELMTLLYGLQRTDGSGVTADTVRSVKDSPSFMAGKSNGDLYFQDWFDVERKVRDNENKAFRDQLEDEQVNQQSWLRKAEVGLMDSPPQSNEAIDSLLQNYQRIFQTSDEPELFKRYKENFSLQARARDEQRNTLKSLVDSRRLTVAELQTGRYLPEIVKEFYDDAVALDKLNAPRVDPEKRKFEGIARKAIATLINKADNDKVLPPSAELAVLHAQADLDRRAADLLRANPNMDPLTAYTQAAMALQDDIANGRGNYKTNGKLGEQAGFPDFSSGAAARNRVTAAQKANASAVKQIETGGIAVLSQAKERGLLTEREAIQMQDPSRGLSPTVMAYTRVLQRMGKLKQDGTPYNEYDVADMMLSSFNLKRQRPFAQQWADSTLSPELQRLLALPTGARTSRALTSAGLVGPGAAQQAVKYIANSLGVDPQAVATFINYETAGQLLSGQNRSGLDTFGGAGGQYLGWIQFSPANQRKYGVKPGMNYMDMANAVVRYLKDTGIRPGDTLSTMYQAVQAPAFVSQARSAGRNFSADSNGSVSDHVENMLKMHGAKASSWLRKGAQGGSVWRNPQLMSTIGRKVLGELPLTSGFGEQESFRKNPHEGNDYGVGQGSKLSLRQPGEVIQVGSPSKGNGGYGGFVDVRLADGNVVRLAHLTDVYVRPGDRIGAKQMLALSGGTPGTRGGGRSTGPHVHIEHLSGPTGIQETTKGKRNPSAIAKQIYVD
jgi:murein DD-endopeptidase MepM/ murein hydrolase activator NlpD